MAHRSSDLGLRRLTPRRRRRGPTGGDPDVELRFWTDEWDAHIRRGETLFSPHGLELLGEGHVAESYEGRRWQEARAQVLRILREAEIEAGDFFAGKVVLEIGPGPIGFPEACGARVALAVEPLAPRFADHGLLLDGDAIYLPVGAECIPLVDASVDVIVARNCLDHVRDPAAVCDEALRVLRSEGTFLVNVDIDHPPTSAEPHSFGIDDVRRLLHGFTIVRQRVLEEPHGVDGRVFVAVARPA